MLEEIDRLIVRALWMRSWAHDHDGVCSVLSARLVSLDLPPLNNMPAKLATGSLSTIDYR